MDKPINEITESLVSLAKHVSTLEPEQQKSFWEATTNFIDVRIDTLRSWLGGTLPTGVRACKLRCFLTVVGYQAERRLEQDADLQFLEELIGYAILDVEKIMRSLEYESTDSVLRLIRENTQLSCGRRFKIQELRHQYGNRLEEHKQAIERYFSSLLVGLKKDTENSAMVSAFILHIAHAVVGLVPMLEVLKTLSPQERSQFREKCSGKTIQRAIDGLADVSIEDTALPSDARNHSTQQGV